jgi:hypothetical protein
MAQCQSISDFPIELIHKVFSYLGDEEILHSFGNVNQYFKNIVINYIRVVCIDLLPIEDENGDVQIIGADRKSLDILFEIPDLIFELVIGSKKYVKEKQTQFKQRRFRSSYERRSNRMKLMICCKRSTDFCYHDIINHHLEMTRQLCEVESLHMEIFQIAWKYPSDQCSHMWNGTCSVQLNSIPRYTNLRKLYFKGDLNVESGVDDDFIRDLNLKQLVDLSLEFCHEITDVGLSYISKECNLLKRFVLIANNNVTDVGLAYIAHGCQQVENLKISMCNKITDNGIEKIGIGCKKLKIIYLRDVHVTDESLKQVLNEFEKVEKLTLDGYSNISDTVIPHAMDSCKNLQEIKLPNCTNVTNSSFERFDPHYTYLKGGGDGGGRY